ncbi:MAG TPA: response regulator [Kiritimatiellia bacterium]|nr:response regulator [Kiritimatiellia bacterium]HRZ12267.1 response regulator [Kiritimatiellia bacterium]HSA17975.1 response regulator [Kiritimatiellia bacterium]
MPNITVQTSRILLVEDDHDDAALAQRAFHKANVWNPLDVVRSGQEAWDYLTHQGAFADAEKFPAPLFVLVDLNLPGMDGRELISRIQADSGLRRIPLLVVSTSDYEKDIEFGRKLGVQHYVIKPLQPQNILAFIGALPGFQIILGTAK